jgi:hypothetical protein
VPPVAAPENAMRRLIAVGLLLVPALLLAEQPEKRPPLLFEDDFKKGADHWQPTDAAAWKVIDVDGGKAYCQFQQSKFKPPHRSPFNFALVKDLVVGDFVLEAKVRSTCKDYPHRDVCLIFGYQAPDRYYYSHLGKKTDDHANQIFIVNKADRVKISTKTSDGTPWDDNWHRVKVVRTIADGKIEVYFDDMTKPMQTATDRTFVWGQVGLGSFDDTADWMDVKISGVKAEKGR